MPDLDKLGIQANENKKNNYIEKNNGDVVCIDSGNMTFMSPFKPETYLSEQLPNEGGRDIKNTWASIGKAYIKKPY
jgi:hypothetical protein